MNTKDLAMLTLHLQIRLDQYLDDKIECFIYLLGDHANLEICLHDVIS
jgi:hypothetical protein